MSVESTDSETADLPDEVGRHEFLIQGENAVNDPFESALTLKNAIDGMPKTKATFLLGHYFERQVARTLNKRILDLLGSWRVPDYYTQTSDRAMKWVNPNYHDKSRFAAVYVRCECGALVVREERSKGTVRVQGEHEHTDDCCREWRTAAREALVEARVDAVDDLVRLCHTPREIAPRFGLAPDGFHGNFLTPRSIDIEREKERARQRRANTAAVLLKRHSPSEVATVYDLSEEYVKREVRRWTDADPRDLYETRRARAREESNEAALDDVRRVIQTSGEKSRQQYDVDGKWRARTVERKFDTDWQGVLERAEVADDG
ncbi:hypothetical protein [Halococcus saccharolyticus]|uniref:Uncharacterized protein n=1 Tax=Halococcus saccharolyticus DSM 5350 TaxID=1227455 RepID=M0MT63_9EURY|nr:hypothetical protein [Halococcus saccharolyticus]EMA47934.1 hypothetical protein C449_00640 [Halococcus saccharolyticus DSM 5350]